MTDDQLDAYQLDVLRRYAFGATTVAIAGATGYDHEFVINVVRAAGTDRARAQQLVDAQGCCPGEPLRGDPQGLHTHECPVYLDNARKFEATRRRPPPRAGTPARVPPGGILASYDAYSCLDCGSRYFERRDCCTRPLLPVTVTITRREET